eukprot:6213481-Pleurochrysis_carterae.AAC.3
MTCGSTPKVRDGKGKYSGAVHGSITRLSDGSHTIAMQAQCCEGGRTRREGLRAERVSGRVELQGWTKWGEGAKTERKAARSNGLGRGGKPIHGKWSRATDMSVVRILPHASCHTARLEIRARPSGVAHRARTQLFHFCAENIRRCVHSMSL